MNINIVNALPVEEWSHYVKEHPEGNIFHTPEMFQVFSCTKDHRPELWAATTNNRILALLLPVRITIWNKLLLRRFTSRSVAYGSVLCAPGVEGKKALDKLLQVYIRSMRGKILFTELRNMSELSDIQPTLLAKEFNYEEHLNYLIKLDRPLNDIMQNIGHRTRKKIRQGLRQGKVTIEEVNQPEQLSVCYELISQAYARARVPLADRSLFEAAFKILYPKSMVKFLLARVDDVYTATTVELIYKDVIYGWYSGIDRKYSRYNPNELLMWYLLRFGNKNGYHVYDFGGAGKPGEKYGVRNFKAKFGGELVCFGRNIFCHSPRLLKFSTLVYDFYRKIFTFKHFK